MSPSRPTVHYLSSDDEAGRRLQALVQSLGYRFERWTEPEDFLAGYEPRRSECVVSDLRLSQMGGLELQRRLRARHSGATLLFLTQHGDVLSAVKAMKEGAHDFVQLPTSSEILLDTIQDALRRNEHVWDEDMRRGEIRSRFQELTPRESEVLAFVVQGLPSKAIAMRLGRSKKTVDLHRANIMKKLEATSIPELVRKFCLADMDAPVAPPLPAELEGAGRR